MHALSSLNSEISTRCLPCTVLDRSGARACAGLESRLERPKRFGSFLSFLRAGELPVILKRRKPKTTTVALYKVLWPVTLQSKIYLGKDKKRVEELPDVLFRTLSKASLHL